MTLWLLFLRSRLAFPAAVGLLLNAALYLVIGNLWGEHADIVLIASVMLPLAAATIVGATTTSPFGELEQMLSRSLVPLRFGQVAGLLTIAALALFGAVTAWHDSALGGQFVRNILGLAGASLLCAFLFGGRWSWTVPVGFSMLVLVQRGAAGGDAPQWAWVVQPTSRLTVVIALSLLIAGLCLVARFGARRVDDDGAA